MAKGCLFISGFMIAIILIITVVIIAGVAVFIFGPDHLPNSPCLLDSNCKPQKLCCTWRCDSTTLDWWTCTDDVCNILGKPAEDPGLKCGCRNLKCVDMNAEAK